MSFRYLCSLTAFSLVFSVSAMAEDAVVEQNAPKSTESSAAAEQKEAAPKRQKPHYAGVRRQQPRTNISDGDKKSSSKVKNKWFSSKTQPKVAKKETAQADEPLQAESAADRPYFQRVDNRPLAPIASQSSLSPSESNRVEHLEVKANHLRVDEEGLKYPRHGFQAPNGHAFITAEWLYWRARQSGMEYAFAKTVDFKFESGFRVGVGVHMPYDGWDVYVSYTRFVPDHSHNVEGSVFPLLLYGATNNVDAVHAHWKIKFQSVDLQLGRVYYIAKTLCLRPYFGIKGAWIDQDADMRYRGGYIPAGQEFKVDFDNNFKGAGPLIGVDATWQLGLGFNLFGNAAAALVIGQFDVHNKQHQSGGFVPIDLKTDQNLATSALRLEAGLAWDRNFCEEACHFGISAGFESQYWTSQNQIEQFTTAEQPYYVRSNGDLALYGLTLRARVDF